MGEARKLRDHYVYDDIIAFLNLAHYSYNTKLSYEKGIRDFFREIKNKDIEHLTQDDIPIIKKEVELFRTLLKERGYSNNTINNKVAGLRRLYTEFKANKYNVDVDFFSIIKALPSDTDSYDPFTIDEAMQLYELALDEIHDGEIKSKFILFCLDTCIRKSAALKIKWSDFKVINEKEVRIIAIDKGNKDFRAMIHYDFYKELLELKDDSELVFNLKLSTVDKMISRLVTKLNVDSERNLTFHSLRKAGIEFKYRYTGDIKVAQKAANHSDFSLTFNTYVSTEDYGVMGAVSLLHKNEESILNQLSFEELKKLMNSLEPDIFLRVEKMAREMFSK